MHLKLAEIENSEEVFQIYVQAIKEMNNLGMHQWNDVYPSYDDIANDIEKKELYIGKVENKIAVAIVVNKEFDDEYEDANWTDSSNNFVVIHRLCVSPRFQNMGIAKKTMQEIESKVSSMGKSSVRLDTFSKNPHAIRLYSSLGYEAVGEANWEMGKFIIMEKVLRK